MTENTNITPLDKRCAILADLWIRHDRDSEFKDFIEYCDLALPLAYAIDSKIIKIDYDNDRLNEFIHEAFDILLEGLGAEDNNYESLQDLFDKVVPE
jgi:hypothetical protein